MSLYKQLLNIAQDEDDIIDLSVNSFVEKIEATLGEVDNKIIKLLDDYMKTGDLQQVNLEFALTNKVQIQNLLRSGGYYKDVETLLDSQLKLIDDIVKEYDLFKFTIEPTNISRTAIRELIKNETVIFEQLGAEATSQIYTGIYNSLLTSTPLSDAVGAIRSAIKNIGLKRYAGTYANTEYMNFNRSVSNIMSNQTGWNRYQFVGPIDAKISHDFCMKHVGDIMTKKRIDKFSKQYGFDIFVKGGGYNCRHKWMNVPPDYKVSQREQTMIDERLEILNKRKKKKKRKKKET